ncbi:MAG: hypothetical protein IJ523_04590 [Succinivibrionaceae bacterium]|nr:hypothetical protein [Succinivibrionaceae bacterium]
MKALLGMLIAAVIFASAGTAAAEEITPEQADRIVSQMKNPFVPVASLEEAEEQSGYKIERLKAVPEYYTAKPEVSVVKGGEMIQIAYQEPMDEKRMLYRASKKLSSQVMNGDYSDYERDTEKRIGSYRIRIKGSEDVIYAAEWTSDGVNYCLLVDDGLDDVELEEMLTGRSASE